MRTNVFSGFGFRFIFLVSVLVSVSVSVSVTVTSSVFVACLTSGWAPFRFRFSVSIFGSVPASVSISVPVAVVVPFPLRFCFRFWPSSWVRFQCCFLFVFWCLCRFHFGSDSGLGSLSLPFPPSRFRRRTPSPSSLSESCFSIFVSDVDVSVRPSAVPAARPAVHGGEYQREQPGTGGGTMALGGTGIMWGGLVDLTERASSEDEFEEGSSSSGSGSSCSGSESEEEPKPPRAWAAAMAAEAICIASSGSDDGSGGEISLGEVQEVSRPGAEYVEAIYIASSGSDEKKEDSCDSSEEEEEEKEEEPRGEISCRNEEISCGNEKNCLKKDDDGDEEEEEKKRNKKRRRQQALSSTDYCRNYNNAAHRDGAPESTSTTVAAPDAHRPPGSGQEKNDTGRPDPPDGHDAKAPQNSAIHASAPCGNNLFTPVSAMPAPPAGPGGACHDEDGHGCDVSMESLGFVVDCRPDPALKLRAADDRAAATASGNKELVTAESAFASASATSGNKDVVTAARASSAGGNKDCVTAARVSAAASRNKDDVMVALPCAERESVVSPSSVTLRRPSSQLQGRLALSNSTIALIALNGKASSTATATADGTSRALAETRRGLSVSPSATTAAIAPAAAPSWRSREGETASPTTATNEDHLSLSSSVKQMASTTRSSEEARSSHRSHVKQMASTMTSSADEARLSSSSSVKQLTGVKRACPVGGTEGVDGEGGGTRGRLAGPRGTKGDGKIDVDATYTDPGNYDEDGLHDDNEGDKNDNGRLRAVFDATRGGGRSRWSFVKGNKGGTDDNKLGEGKRKAADTSLSRLDGDDDVDNQNTPSALSAASAAAPEKLEHLRPFHGAAETASSATVSENAAEFAGNATKLAENAAQLDARVRTERAADEMDDSGCGSEISEKAKHAAELQLLAREREQAGIWGEGTGSIPSGCTDGRTEEPDGGVPGRPEGALSASGLQASFCGMDGTPTNVGKV